MRNFYLISAIVGTIVPWIFFGSFYNTSGFDVIKFVTQLFANDAASGFSADVLISLTVFWVWSFFDSKAHDVSKWWTVILAGFCVGLSLALPLYLFLREEAPKRSS
ncbi:DUF2834 domain-containing protein [Kiloniella laminariae]|uniref:DUF2834 domain-containing protein n=1 Tax=Kiloniella laminariae TaxID=454162 RepID=UPI00036A4535|nr:DUF2834 domain-containing protein [Kiloniella laminariae]